MLFKALQKIVEAQGMTDALRGRIDVLYAAGKLTDAEYRQLTGSENNG